VDYFRSPFGRFSVAREYAVSYCEGFTLLPVVCGRWCLSISEVVYSLALLDGSFILVVQLRPHVNNAASAVCVYCRNSSQLRSAFLTVCAILSTQVESNWRFVPRSSDETLSEEISKKKQDVLTTTHVRIRGTSTCNSSNNFEILNLKLINFKLLC
jgi:hypothetical protein